MIVSVWMVKTIFSLPWQDSTSVDKAASSSNSPAVPIDKLNPFFRELDLRVFTVLHYGILSRTILDSEQMTKEREELRLRPPQLAFLLQDLSSKLSSTFSLFGRKVGVACNFMRYRDIYTYIVHHKLHMYFLWNAGQRKKQRRQ